jgi:hypothetical protein
MRWWIVPLRIGIDRPFRQRLFDSFPTGIENTMGKEDVVRGRLVDQVAIDLRNFLPWSDDEILGARALVRPDLAHIRDRPLPEVDDGAAIVAGRLIDDYWTVFQVGEADEIRRGEVGGENADLVLVVVVNNDIALLGSEDFLMGKLPLIEGDDRQRPDVGLGGALEIHLVVDLLDHLRRRRQAHEELDRADPGLNGSRRCFFSSIGRRSEAQRAAEPSDHRQIPQIS